MASIFDYQFNVGGNFTAAMEGMAESTWLFCAKIVDGNCFYVLQRFHPTFCPPCHKIKFRNRSNSMQLWGMGRELCPGLMAGKVEIEKSKWDDSEDVQFGEGLMIAEWRPPYPPWHCRWVTFWLFAFECRQNNLD